jgi:glutathione S-transferase
MVLLPSKRPRPLFWTSSLVGLQSKVISYRASDFGRFNQLHPTKIPEAQERYGNELKRVVGVLDRHLKDRNYLVGDKCTYADLAFVMWNVSIGWSLAGGPTKFDEDEYPNFKRWMDSLKSRPGVLRVLMNMQATEMKSDGTRG